MPIKLPRKITRLLHDIYSNICVGRTAFVEHSHSLTSTHVLAAAAEWPFFNPLEDRYYGEKNTRLACHAPIRLLELSDIYVTGSETLIFSGPHTLLRLCASHDHHPVRKIRHPIKTLALRIEEPVFILGGRAPGNKGHFLIEHMPRLIVAYQALGDNFPRHILATPGHADWQRDYLRQFGFGDIEVIEASPGTTWCRHAWTVPNLSQTGTAELCPPALYRRLVECIKKCSAPLLPRPAFFLTRKDAPSRHLTNEDVIFSIAERFIPGLRRISLAELSVPKQFELLAHAHTIIGAHSQAFRCALYANNALLIQLVPGERSRANEYRFWADNYSFLATLQGNRALSLYANDTHSGDGDFSYSASRFAAELPQLLALAEGLPLP